MSRPLSEGLLPRSIFSLKLSVLNAISYQNYIEHNLLATFSKVYGHHIFYLGRHIVLPIVPQNEID